MKDRIQLDWSRLLGFDQMVTARRPENSGLAKCGSKSSGPSQAISAKAGSKPERASVGAPLSAKVGSKPVSVSSVSLSHRVGANIGSKVGIKV